MMGKYISFGIKICSIWNSTFAHCLSFNVNPKISRLEKEHYVSFTGPEERLRTSQEKKKSRASWRYKIFIYSPKAFQNRVKQ